MCTCQTEQRLQPSTKVHAEGRHFFSWNKRLCCLHIYPLWKEDNVFIFHKTISVFKQHNLCCFFYVRVHTQIYEKVGELKRVTHTKAVFLWAHFQSDDFHMQPVSPRTQPCHTTIGLSCWCWQLGKLVDMHAFPRLSTVLKFRLFKQVVVSEQCGSLIVKW